MCGFFLFEISSENISEANPKQYRERKKNHISLVQFQKKKKKLSAKSKKIYLCKFFVLFALCVYKIHCTSLPRKISMQKTITGDLWFIWMGLKSKNGKILWHTRFQRVHILFRIEWQPLSCTLCHFLNRTWPKLNLWHFLPRILTCKKKVTKKYTHRCKIELNNCV